ncbi:MAG: hypothetical protein AB1434_12160, partial [Pseudomonadota bacterium]
NPADASAAAAKVICFICIPHLIRNANSNGCVWDADDLISVSLEWPHELSRPVARSQRAP